MNDPKTKAKELPPEPGVYFMKDDEDQVLYIGKATNLTERVKSYFQKGADHPKKIREMVKQIEDIDHLKTESEVEALLQEARLIKDIQPPYNSRMKDDKSRLLIRIRMEEDFPRVELVRETDDLDPERDRYFGPFISGQQLRKAVKILQKLFQFRTCSLDIEETSPPAGEKEHESSPDIQVTQGNRTQKGRFFRPCLLHSIERCTAPCGAEISRDSYRKDIQDLIQFLEGDREELKTELEEKMDEASEALEYERAAVYRDRLQAIEELSRKGTLDDVNTMHVGPKDSSEALETLKDLLDIDFVPRTIDAVDISHLSGKEATGAIVTFVDGEPFKDGYRRYRIQTNETSDDYEMMQEVVRRRFRRLKDEHQPFPHIFLIDGGKNHLREVVSVFENLNIDPPFLVALAKNEGDHLYLRDQQEPLDPDSTHKGFKILQHARDEAHRFCGHYHRILRKKKNN